MAVEKIVLGITVAAGLGLGTLWPGAKAPSAPTTGPAPTEVVLSRSSDGHYYADAEVNGAPVRFLVDSGSTMIALSEADAKKAGINVAPADFELLGEGASGMVRGKEETLDHLAVGGIDQQQVPAAVIEGATTSLLGARFLDTMDEIVIRKGEMTLRKAA